MDYRSPLPSPSHNHKPISPLFNSPRFLNGFLSKGLPETGTQSPTSILEIKSFSAGNFPRNKHSWENLDQVGIGVVLDDEKSDRNFSQRSASSVLFGSKPKIQIPLLPPSSPSPNTSPRSPADFGIKTRNLQIPGCSSPFGSVNSIIQTKNSPPTLPESLSPTEMELSEDYTCVTFHGPNPKTTHIYDDCVLKTEYYASPEKLGWPAGGFLGFCNTCKKNLQDGKDIFMYRGEKAFCRSECRSQEMLFEDAERACS